MEKIFGTRFKACNNFATFSCWGKYPKLQFGFRVARNTISTFIPELCQAIVEEYKDEVITCPTASNECRDIANEY